MKKIICITVILAVFAVCAHGQQKKNQLRFGMHFESGGGISASSLYDFVNKTLAQMSSNMGVNIKILKYGSNEETINSVIKGESNSTFMWPQFIHYLEGENKNIIPIATYTVAKKRKAAYCLWHTKKVTVNSIDDIKGKTLILDYYTPLDLGEMKLVFLEKQLDAPLWQVFSAFVNAPSQNSAFIALAMGDADYFWAKSDSEYYLKMINPSVATQLTKSFCTEEKYSRGTIVINRKEFSDQEFESVKKSTLQFFKGMKKTAKTDGTLAAITRYMEMAKIEVIPADANEFEVEQKEFAMIRKKGWLNEVEFISRMMADKPTGKPIQIKPDIEYCKKKCGEDYKCIVACSE